MMTGRTPQARRPTLAWGVLLALPPAGAVLAAALAGALLAGGSTSPAMAQTPLADLTAAARCRARREPTPEQQLERCRLALASTEIGEELRAALLQVRAQIRMDREGPADLDAAVADLDQAIRLNPLVEYAHSLAVARMLRGDLGPGVRQAVHAGFGESLAEMDALVRARPTDPDLLFLRAQLHMIRGEAAAGQRDLSEAERLWRQRR
jgi:hypothetical protein